MNITGRKKSVIVNTHQKTERKQAEEELRAVSFYARSLIEASLDPLVTISPEGKITDVNEATVKVTGVSRDKLIGTDFSNYFTEPEKAREGYKQVFTKGYVTDYPLTIRHREGKLTDVLYNAVVYKDVNGKVQGVFAAARDITEHKRTEEKIRVLSKIPAENPNPVMRISRDGILLYINEAGMNLLAGCHLQAEKKVPPMFHRSVLQSLNSSSPREMNIEQGNRLYSFFIAPIVDADYANLYGRDITDRKKTENMLQKQQEEQQVILDSVPALIFYKDRENRFIRVNKILAEVMGMSKKQLEGKSLFDLYPKERAEAYWRDDKEVIASGKPRRNIIEPLETKKGSLWVQTDKIPYRDAQGNIIGIIGFTTDITERRKVEAELKESHEQMRILARHLQKDREIERARIAKELHDELGQTLTAIKIDYTWLQKKLGLLQKPLRKEVKDLSSLIDATIHTVRKLTMDLRPALLDDLGLIPAVEWMVKGIQKRTGIKIKLTVKPVNLRLDPDLSLTIFRITQEALTNIIRYARATRAQVALEKRPGYLNLMIKDNGKGIRQEKIKNPHSLGLVGMKERVMFHNGKIEITGEKNKGTTIKVFVPLKKGKSENTDSR